MDITTYLRSYASGEGKCGQASLAEAIGVQPGEEGGLAAAPARLGTFASTAIEGWTALASRLRAPFLSAVRNLFACATAEDLPTLLFVLEWGLAQGAFAACDAQALSALADAVRRRLPAGRRERAFDALSCQRIIRRLAIEPAFDNHALDKALSAITDRRFRADELSSLWRLLPWSSQARLRAAVFASAKTRGDLITPHPSALVLLAAWPEGIERSGLLFLCTEPKDRLSLFASLRPSHRKVLLRRLPLRDWYETLVKEQQASRRAEALRGLTRSRRGQVLAQYLSDDSSQCPVDVLQRCLPYATGASFKRVILAERFSLDAVAGKRGLVRRALRVLKRTPKYGDVLPRAANDRFVAAAMRCDCDLAGQTFSRMVAWGRRDQRQHASHGKLAPDYLRLAELVARRQLGALLPAFEDGITADEFAAIGCAAADSKKAGVALSRRKGRRSPGSSLGLQQIFAFRTRGGAQAWEAAIEDVRDKGELPPFLWAAIITTRDAAVVRRAIELWPSRFACLAPRHFTLREQLLLAFESPDVARVVEARTPRRRLLDELPWVQALCAADAEASHDRRPASKRIAAAYEVALVFSLEHARYLAWLARRVVIPGQDCSGAGRQFDDLYRTYELPKKAGGTRTITAPDDTLKRLQRQLLTKGFLHIPVHRAAHGFRVGRSVLTNALPHVRQPLVVNVDIRAFFPSTPYSAIVDACSALAGGRLSPAAVRLVADICAYGGALPTGAPTSPAIANIILAPVDHALSRAAARWRIRYTRYADDLTFSGRGEVHRIIPFVKKLLAEHGYVIDDSKTNLFRQGRRQMVTGLVVNQKPNLPRRLRRRLRAAVHHRSRGLPATWHDRPMGDDELAGRLAALNLVQPEEARRLRQSLRRASNARAEGGEAV